VNLRLLILAPAAALLLFTPPAAAATPRTHVIIVDKMKFGAVPPGLHVGDLIIWRNQDMFRHTATAADGSFDVDLPAGKSGKVILRKAGAISFKCKFHPGMTGILKVAR
jgi:plastocyanin